MKKFQLSLILIFLLFITACQVNTIFQDGASTTHTMHSESTHAITTKDFPTGFFLQPLSDVDLEARAAFLMDADRGRVLFEENSHEPLGVASMSKIMSELLVLEAIDQGIIDWDDSITISEYAYTISHQPGYASIKLDQDKRYTVSDLFHGMAITSANGATIALAEAVAGTEKEFVTLMNEKADTLNLEDADFVNSTGLTNHDLKDYHSTGSLEDYNKMSASDLAKLSTYLLDEYPELLDMTRLPEFDILGESIENSNWMLPQATENFLGVDFTFPEVDGLKTGFTKEAGYGFTGTVQINGTRFISVIIGTEELGDRFVETSKLYHAIMEQGIEQTSH